jgi:hypothetical protein
VRRKLTVCRRSSLSNDAKAPAIERLLAEFDANIVDGPNPEAKIRLRI